MYIYIYIYVYDTISFIDNDKSLQGTPQSSRASSPTSSRPSSPTQTPQKASSSTMDSSEVTEMTEGTHRMAFYADNPHELADYVNHKKKHGRFFKERRNSLKLSEQVHVF